MKNGWTLRPVSHFATRLAYRPDLDHFWRKARIEKPSPSRGWLRNRSGRIQSFIISNHWPLSILYLFISTIFNKQFPTAVETLRSTEIIRSVFCLFLLKTCSYFIGAVMRVIPRRINVVLSFCPAKIWTHCSRFAPCKSAQSSGSTSLRVTQTLF